MSQEGGDAFRITQLAADVRSINPRQSSQPLLSQIGKGSDETVWTKLLGYFLNPDADHGLGTAFLTRYLQQLETEDNSPVDPDTASVSDARVVTEPMAGGRRADVLIHTPGEWFILIEAKVGAEVGTSQLESYATANRLAGAVDVEDIPKKKRVYVFLTLPSRDIGTIYHRFTHQTWESILTCLNDIKENPTLSQITASKLTEFALTIDKKMKDHEIDRQSQLEYTMLFNEYRDVIEKVQNAPRQLSKAVRAEWPEVVRGPRCSPDSWADDSRDDDWTAADSGASNPNSHVFRSGWKADSGILGLHLEVEPTPALRMREVFEEEYFRIQLQVHQNEARELFKDKFYDTFEGDQRYNDSVYIKPKRSTQATFTETEFAFEVGSQDYDYYTRLGEALDDHTEFAYQLDDVVDEVRREYDKTE